MLESSFNGFIFDMVGWGAVLAVLGLGLIFARLWRRTEPLTPELTTALALPAVFVVLIVVTRAQGDSAVSRYKYTVAVLLVMLFAEVFRGFGPRRTQQLALGSVIVLFLAAGNLNWMAQQSGIWRANVAQNKLYFTALREVGRATACRTTIDPPDPLMEPQLNCLLYDQVVVRGRHSLTPAQVSALTPQGRARIAKYAEQIRAAASPKPEAAGG
jgi:hypothetical protein